MLLIRRCALFGLLAASLTMTAAPGTFAAPAKVQGARAPQQGKPNNTAINQAINSYLNRLRAKLVQNWLLPDGKNNVVVTATLQPDGAAAEIQVVSTPKNDLAEASSSDAFSKAEPLEALPSGIKTAKLTLTFISNADPHGDSSSNILTRMDPIAEAGNTGAPPSSK